MQYLYYSSTYWNLCRKLSLQSPLFKFAKRKWHSSIYISESTENSQGWGGASGIVHRIDILRSFNSPAKSTQLFGLVSRVGLAGFFIAG